MPTASCPAASPTTTPDFAVTTRQAGGTALPVQADIADRHLTKFGGNGFTESLRQGVTQRPVRVGVLAPGGVAANSRSVRRREEPDQGNARQDPDHDGKDGSAAAV
jgi:hypothetical protein